MLSTISKTCRYRKLAAVKNFGDEYLNMQRNKRFFAGNQYVQVRNKGHFEAVRSGRPRKGTEVHENFGSIRPSPVTEESLPTAAEGFFPPNESMPLSSKGESAFSSQAFAIRRRRCE